MAFCKKGDLQNAKHSAKKDLATFSNCILGRFRWLLGDDIWPIGAKLTGFKDNHAKTAGQMGKTLYLALVLCLFAID